MLRKGNAAPIVVGIHEISQGTDAAECERLVLREAFPVLLFPGMRACLLKAEEEQAEGQRGNGWPAGVGRKQEDAGVQRNGRGRR